MITTIGVGVTSNDDRDRITARRQLDFEDLQREQSGVQGNRIARFINEDARPGHVSGKRSATRTLIELSALEQLLLNDPEYAAAYHEVDRLLRDAEQRTDAAIAQTDADLADANADHSDIVDKANRLPDGRAVFRGADGRVYTEDGQVVSDTDAAGVVWKDGAPTYEDLLGNRKRIENLQKRRDDLERYRHDVLAPARDKMDDQENPISRDDLDKIKIDMQTQMPLVLSEPTTEAEGFDMSMPSGTAKPPL
ncbi:MAG: hypothetical protein AAF950_06910 [Pseudomonadota bacterium]